MFENKELMRVFAPKRDEVKGEWKKKRVIMEAVQTSEKLVNSYKSTRCYNPENSHIHSHRHGSLKSHENGKSCIVESSIICTHLQILLGRSNQGK
jgi:hypothetical protein